MEAQMVMFEVDIRHRAMAYAGRPDREARR